MLSEMIKFNELVKRPFDGEKYIAHCHEGEKELLRDVYKKGENCLILIGPEGDFSPEEIKFALENGFKPISLGTQRLRTETAAVVATVMVATVNGL